MKKKSCCSLSLLDIFFLSTTFASWILVFRRNRDKFIKIADILGINEVLAVEELYFASDENTGELSNENELDENEDYTDEGDEGNDSNERVSSVYESMEKALDAGLKREEQDTKLAERIKKYDEIFSKGVDGVIRDQIEANNIKYKEENRLIEQEFSEMIEEKISQWNKKADEEITEERIEQLEQELITERKKVSFNTISGALSSTPLYEPFLKHLTSIRHTEYVPEDEAEDFNEEEEQDLAEIESIEEEELVKNINILSIRLKNTKSDMELYKEKIESLGIEHKFFAHKSATKITKKEMNLGAFKSKELILCGSNFADDCFAGKGNMNAFQYLSKTNAKINKFSSGFLKQLNAVITDVNDRDGAINSDVKFKMVLYAVITSTSPLEIYISTTKGLLVFDPAFVSVDWKQNTKVLKRNALFKTLDGNNTRSLNFLSKLVSENKVEEILDLAVHAVKNILSQNEASLTQMSVKAGKLSKCTSCVGIIGFDLFLNTRNPTKEEENQSVYRLLVEAAHDALDKIHQEELVSDFLSIYVKKKVPEDWRRYMCLVGAIKLDEKFSLKLFLFCKRLEFLMKKKIAEFSG
eukprot:snap_masked-scaffold_47-processed-gene-1.46-mRNA-1 protein AED:0.07 eAED:1.00 QI:0/0/0/1/1/1/2/0/582